VHPPSPPDGVFSIAVSRPPLPTSDKGAYRREEESPLRNTDMPYIVMVIQSVIIFITLSAFILYVFSPRSLPLLNPTAAPSFTVTFETADRLPFPPPPPLPPLNPSDDVVVDDEDGKKALPSHHSHSMLARFKKAAVVSDHGICSEIGRSILTKGGNAIDVAIATLFCVGVTNPQSSGIGGGFFMQIYMKETCECKTINARETAPKDIDIKAYQKNPNHTSYGWKSIGVPGEIKGFWHAFNTFGSGNPSSGGKVKWGELIEPTIKLCSEGIPVSEYLATILETTKDKVSRNNELRMMFTNPATNVFYKEGEIMHRPKLAKTLQRLADAADPAELFYKGEMAQTIVKEIQEGGGYLTLEDLEDYEAADKPSVTSSITPTISQCGPPPPSSWIVTQLIVKVMAELYPEPRRREDLDTVLFYHRLIEAEKFAYALRTHLGDPYHLKKEMAYFIRNLTDPTTAKIIAAKISDVGPLPKETYQSDGYVKEDHGTSHVSVIDEQGNAVAVTSTINLRLGSNVASSLGIIWNDQMDDFSVPGHSNAFGFAASAANSMEPGKTPMSSMSPTI
ncbi:hypothetical protein PENTCL1PPCAC_97, partial [Pristionchus entomophagus]